MKKFASVTPLALLALAAPVGAQTAQWSEVCTDPAGPEFEGSTCMSARLSYNSATGAVNFWVWNLAGFGDSEATSRIDAFGLYGVPWNAAGISSFAAHNAAGGVRTADWQIGTTGIPGAGCCSLTFGIKQVGGPTKKDVVSSNHPTPSSYDVTTWTGAGDLATGSGAFKFSWFVGTGLVLDPTKVYVYAHHKASVNGESDQFYCLADAAIGAEDFCGDDPDDPGDPQETVPEPATMTLLATGLVGMAAARRKRKQLNS